MNNNYELVSCNFCGNQETKLQFSSGQLNENEDHSYFYQVTTDSYGYYGNIVKCKKCGLLYQNPRVRTDLILSEYKKMTDPGYLEQDSARFMNAHLSLSTIKKNISNGKLLEIGSFAGNFLYAAASYFDVTGVEPSAWATRILKSKYSFAIYENTIEHANFKDGTFDIIAMIDVIEHLPDPESTIKEISRITKSGGYLYIVTPDVESLSAKILKGRWWGLRPAHLYYFSEKTITQLLEKNGFRILKINSFGRIFTWDYWCSRLKFYPAPIYKSLKFLIQFFDVGDKYLYLNTRDSMEVMAQKF